MTVGLKHLPGRHDQRSHGSWAVGRKFKQSFDDLVPMGFNRPEYAYMISPDDENLADVHDFGGERYINHYRLVDAHPEVFGEDPIKDGWIRVRDVGLYVSFETEHVDTRTLRRLQRLVDDDLIHLYGKYFDWSSESDEKALAGQALDFMQAKHIDADYKLKHLPGRHDQKAHTPKAYSGHVNPYAVTSRIVDNYHDLAIVGGNNPHGGKGSYITPNDELLDLVDVSHWEALLDYDVGAHLGIPSDVTTEVIQEFEAGGQRVINKAFADALRGGAIRVRDIGSTFGVHTASVDDRTLRRLQRLYDDEKLGVRPDQHVVWEAVGGKDYLDVDAPTFLSARSVGELRRDQAFKQLHPPSMCSCSHLFDVAPWHSVNLYSYVAKQANQPNQMPEYASQLAMGTAEYENKIRTAWDWFKLHPTEANAKAFAELLILFSGKHWPEVMARVLGVDPKDLTQAQLDLLRKYLDEHHDYIKNSLLPDVLKAVQAGRDLSSLDYRTTFLYAGALWMFGNVATVMFDGLSLRDLADLFLFAGPNDEATCTGDRGCAQYANRILTVAEILADDIFPGRMRCLTNCRHMWIPVASPLKEKHLPGRHDQKTHTPKAYAGAEPWQMTMEEIKAKYPKAGALVDGRVVREHIPNQDSIDASIDYPTVLNGIYDVPLSEFYLTGKHYSLGGTQRIRELADAIKKSGEVNPLIVVIDAEAKPYILEGATRAEALYLLGAKSLPAQIVVDEGSIYDRIVQEIAAGNSIPQKVLAEYPALQYVKGIEKHLPGKHDQRTHTPKAYLGSTPSDEVRQLADPQSKVNQDAVKNWDKLSQEERMALANPDAINLRMQEQLDRYRTDYKAAHDLAGEKLTAKTYSKIADNANARIDSLKDALNPATEQKLRSYVDDHMQKAVEGALKEGGLKDVSAADLDALMQRNVDKLVFQEIESRKRQLGDHGIRHVLGNVESMDMMFDDPEFPKISGMDRLVAVQTMVDHDMGYTAGIATQSFAATKSHEMFSEQYAKSEGYEKLFGADNAKELQRLVATHAETHVDWEKDPVASAVRTADNTALFAKEKYPALFNDVPGAASELYRLQLAQVGGSADKVLPVVKKNLKDLVDKSDLDARQKEDLGMAVEEVFPLSGKFTLGMGAAEIQGYDYADGLMHVKVQNKPEREALNGVFDLGDRQFGKFMAAYDLDGAPGSGLRLKDKESGKVVIQIDSSDAKEPTTGELGELYSLSVRPTIRSVQRQLGPSSTRSNREKIWPAIEAKMGEKLTASELSSFKSHFLAGTLDQFPLTEKENAFLTRERLKELGLGWLDGLLKHLPGRHDQQRHAGDRGGLAKEVIDDAIGRVPEHLSTLSPVELGEPGYYNVDKDIVMLSPKRILGYRNPRSSGLRYVLHELGHPVAWKASTKLGVELPSDYTVDRELFADDFARYYLGERASILHPQVFDQLDNAVVEKHLPGRHDQQTHTPHIYASGTPVTREWLHDGGSRLFEQLHHPVVRKMIEDTLVDYGVTQEELEGLSGFTTQPPAEYGYRVNSRGYFSDPGSPENEDVLGVYSPPSKVIHVPEIVAYREDGGKILLHELGHHVSLTSSNADAKLAYTFSVRKAVFGGREELSPSELESYGLDAYSLSSGLEFLADSYMVMKAGDDSQKTKLERLWQGSSEFEDLEAVFKELIKVLRIIGRERNGIIEFITVPVEVDQSILDKVPWYYIKETSNNV